MRQVVGKAAVHCPSCAQRIEFDVEVKDVGFYSDRKLAVRLEGFAYVDHRCPKAAS